MERVVRPIVEGQIRGFLKEHPAVVAAVDCGEGGQLGRIAELAALRAAVEDGTYRPERSEIEVFFGRAA